MYILQKNQFNSFMVIQASQDQCSNQLLGLLKKTYKHTKFVYTAALNRIVKIGDYLWRVPANFFIKCKWCANKSRRTSKSNIYS